jgi:hypothetical protein
MARGIITAPISDSRYYFSGFCYKVCLSRLNNMLEQITASLVVALIGAVTFVAYKHPRSYRKFYDPLSIIVLAIFAGRILYGIGFGNGFNSAIFAVRDLNKGAFVNTPPYPSESFLVAFVLPISILLWLRFLLFLPSILDLEDKDPPSDEQKQVNHELPHQRRFISRHRITHARGFRLLHGPQ